MFLKLFVFVLSWTETLCHWRIQIAAWFDHIRLKSVVPPSSFLHLVIFRELKVGFFFIRFAQVFLEKLELVHGDGFPLWSLQIIQHYPDVVLSGSVLAAPMFCFFFLSWPSLMNYVVPLPCLASNSCLLSALYFLARTWHPTGLLRPGSSQKSPAMCCAVAAQDSKVHKWLHEFLTGAGKRVICKKLQFELPLLVCH